MRQVCIAIVVATIASVVLAGPPITCDPAPTAAPNMAYFQPASACADEIGDVKECLTSYTFCSGNVSSCRDLEGCIQRRHQCLSNVPMPSNVSQCQTWYEGLSNAELYINMGGSFLGSALENACQVDSCALAAATQINNAVCSIEVDVCKPPVDPVNFTVTFDGSFTNAAFNTAEKASLLKRAIGTGIARVLKYPESVFQIINLRVVAGKLVADMFLNPGSWTLRDPAYFTNAIGSATANDLSAAFPEFAGATGVTPTKLTVTAQNLPPAGQANCQFAGVSGSMDYFRPQKACVDDREGPVRECFNVYGDCAQNATGRGSCSELMVCIARRHRCLMNAAQPANITGSLCTSFFEALDAVEQPILNGGAFEGSALQSACLTSACTMVDERRVAGQLCTVNTAEACPAPKKIVKFTFTLGGNYPDDIFTDATRRGKVVRAIRKGLARALNVLEYFLQILEIRKGSLVVVFTVNDDSNTAKSPAQIASSLGAAARGGNLATVFSELAAETNVTPQITAIDAEIPDGSTIAPVDLPSPTPAPPTGPTPIPGGTPAPAPASGASAVAVAAAVVAVIAMLF